MNSIQFSFSGKKECLSIKLEQVVNGSNRFRRLSRQFYLRLSDNQSSILLNLKILVNYQKLRTLLHLSHAKVASSKLKKLVRYLHSGSTLKLV